MSITAVWIASNSTDKPIFMCTMKISQLVFRVGFTITALLFFFSCQDKLQESVVETWDDGTPRRVKYYTDDHELAKEKTYYEDGSKKEVGTYKDENRHGLWSYYYKTGHLWSSAHYHEGKEHGPYRTFYSNGQIRYEGKMKHGERTGVWRFYGEDGEKVKQVNYNQSR